MQQDLFATIEPKAAHDVARRLDAPVRLRRIAALCVAPNSTYKRLPMVDAYDQARDVRNFGGGMPVVAHPPCRAWSAYTRHQAKPGPGEADLGLLCADWLRECGGVLEHPAHSRLFDAAGLPKPGERDGDLATVYVEQAWWGYPMRKATWLCFSRVTLADLEIPYRHHDPRSGEGDRRRQQRMSKHQRAATTTTMALWLATAARCAA